MIVHDLTDAELALIDREIRPFLPSKIFDAHAHLFAKSNYNDVPASYENLPENIGVDAFYDYIQAIHPGAETVGGLFFGLVFLDDRQGNNDLVAQETAKSSLDLGQLVVPPDMDPEQVREEVRRGGFVGLKCYHVMADVDYPTWLAPIEDYLPEEHIRIAHEEKLSITLHMVRDRALADPVNQATIRRCCEKYPDMRLILAHAGRAFNPWHTIEGIDSLKGLDNVWFDTSAVTEAGAFEAIIETMGHDRLLYGSDFPVSHMRGRCVAIGDSFYWLYADEMDLNEKHTTLEPVMIGLESLRSLNLAFRRTKLKDSQIEDIFYNNAARLFDLDSR